MKVITHTITHQAKSAVGQIESITHQAKSVGGQIESIMHPANFAARQIEPIMYPAKFAGGRSRLDLLLPSFLPSREEKKKQERRKQSIDSGAEWHTPHMNHVRIETKIQEQKNRPLGSRGVLHTPHMDRVRTETKIQDRIFCPLRGHAVGRMQYAPTTCRQETLFPINSREERIETKMQERIKQSIDSGAEWHTPFMRQGKKKTVWRDTFLEQRARVAVWRDRRLEEKSSHARLQPRVSGKNSKPYKSYLVALSEQLRDIFAA